VGRTVPSYRQALEGEVRRWTGFRKALRGKDVEAFDELMKVCRIYASAAGMATRSVLAAEFLKPKTRYDAQKYLDMLFATGETLLEVFGYTKEKIRREVLLHQKQAMLN
jgi:DNA polymerase elongation subunit (family B)